MSDTKQKTRRQLAEDARNTALSGNWSEAITLNQSIIERFPRDAEAQNRLGHAYLELHQFSSALEAYTAALKIDPANMIARRNLQRLELLHQKGAIVDVQEGAGNGIAIPRTSVFIEEVGKTWVDELVNPIPREDLADVSSGEQLQIVVDGSRLVVTRATGERLGEIEAKTAERVIDLMEKGNRYEVYALGVSPRSLRVILREVFRDPSVGRTVSFPRQISATRAYLRERDMLRQRDESDFLLLDEDDEELEEEETGVEATDEENGESETESFIEETVSVDEDGSRV
ncbi:MAG: tetratricopeptide repeat protein [Thermomicrobiales bacterium]